jgi:hypothetical protein
VRCECGGIGAWKGRSGIMLLHPPAWSTIDPL